MPRQRRFTLHSAAVLSVIGGRPDQLFYVAEVVERTGLVDGTARHILQRMHNEGYLFRYDNGIASPGHATVQYQITRRGKEKATAIASARSPVAMLKAWVMEDEEEE